MIAWDRALRAHGERTKPAPDLQDAGATEVYESVLELTERIEESGLA